MNENGMSNNVFREISKNGASGYLALVVFPALILVDAWGFYNAVSA